MITALAGRMRARSPRPHRHPAGDAARTSRPAATPVPASDLWDQIQKSGVLRVGTSGDYAPFEYYNSRYQLDGFDIGLIREIGKQLGVKVEIKDYAFDGLYNALQLGSIDVGDRGDFRDAGARSSTSISRTSTTPARARRWRMRNPPSRRSPQLEQLADKTVGVQSGSVYETYLQDTLVDTKLMPARNLQSYPDIEQAVTGPEAQADRPGAAGLPAGPDVRAAGRRQAGGRGHRSRSRTPSPSPRAPTRSGGS